MLTPWNDLVRLSCTGVKVPKSGKEGFGVENPNLPLYLRKECSVKKILIFHVVPCREYDFFTQSAPFSWYGDMGTSTLKPSFPDFGELGACAGRTDSQLHDKSRELLRKDACSCQEVGLPLRKRLPATGVIWVLWAQSCKWSPKMSSRTFRLQGPKRPKGSQTRVNIDHFQLF